MGCLFLRKSRRTHTLMTDLYCVFGNPIHQSKSPQIHAAFARQTGQGLRYEARLAPLDDFPATVRAFIDEGGRGANVTVPFKETAFSLATRRTQRADRAGAVNTLIFSADGILGDNTDGVGLLRDIQDNLGFAIAGKRILILGAGGAVRGIVGPLLDAAPAVLVIANRTLPRALGLVDAFSAEAVTPPGCLFACPYDELAGQHFDLVIDATSAGLDGELPPLPEGLFGRGSLAYTMVYGTAAARFLAFARAHGADQTADGSGMLVEQAAESFACWRGVRPETGPVMALLREA